LFMAATIEETILRLNKAFIKGNPHELREVTSSSTSSFAIYQKKVWLSLALISYTLSKIVEKPRYEKLASRGTRFSEAVSEGLQKAAALYRLGKEAVCQQELDDVVQQIQNMESKDMRFLSNLIVKGRTKVAATMYAQGLSLDTVVELTGAERNEVLNYSGKTTMPDRMGRTLSARDRMAYARKLLKGGKTSKR